MLKDRKEICRIISNMLDNPGECEIYPSTEAFDRLERYIENVRVESIGWVYADACSHLDEGIDYRTVEVPSILERALVDLQKENNHE